MGLLESFAQQYVKQLDSNTDPLHERQQIGAQQVDDMIAEHVGAEAGETKEAKNVEEELGRKPSEPERARADLPEKSDETPAAERESLDPEDGPEADLQQAQQEDGPEVSPQTLEDRDHDPAMVEEAATDDHERAEPVQLSPDDLEAAQAEQVPQDDHPGAEVELVPEDSEDVADVLKGFRDDTELTIREYLGEHSRIIEMMPNSLQDKHINEMMNSLQAGNSEIQFAESPVDVPEIPDLGRYQTTLHDNDQVLAGLPYMSLFSDRKRDQ